MTSVVLFVGAAIALWRVGYVRADYWAQLSPWVAFLTGGFAVLAGTLVFRFWRLGERSEYYFRFGERLPFGGETSLGGWHGRTVLVGHAAQVQVRDFPPLVQRAIYIAMFSCIGLATVTNRAVALLREIPETLDKPSKDFCAEPVAPEVEERKPDHGCKLVMRAYKLGYTKHLGTCGDDPQAEQAQVREVCRQRQLDEPYLHYAWRLLDTRTRAIFTPGAGPGWSERLGSQLEHLDAMFHATVDSVAMRPRSSHHLFTNLPDPRPALRDRIRAAIDREACGARLQRLDHFPPMEAGETGPSKLLEHVLAQLLFNPRYEPVVAECKELTIHWSAPVDACGQLAANPRDFLADHDALAAVDEVLAWRSRKAELARIGIEQAPTELATPQRIVSFQCLVVGAGPDDAPVERSLELDGERFRVREARTRAISADGGSQIRLYKRLAELLAEGFGYGRLTSNQAVGARPEETTLAASLREPRFFLTRLELLRDADLFLGNDWLAKRPELLDVYPFHLHLENFVEIFRRQYRVHRGRL